MADIPAYEVGKRGDFASYRDLEVLTKDISEDRNSYYKLELRVRLLEINYAASTASGAGSSQTWTMVFHGITTLIALFLASYPFFHH